MIELTDDGMQDTMMSFYFDHWTLKHLDAWLEHAVDGDDCRADVRAAMLAYAESDPEYWAGQSWPNLFDHVDGWRIVSKWRD
jgi:hypothetical protein